MVATNRAMSAVTDVAVAALTVAPGDDTLIGSVLGAVRVAMDADTGGFYEHQADGFTMPLFLSPVDTWQRIPYGRVQTSLVTAAHPGVGHLVHRRPHRPFALTDIVSERAWWGSELGVAMRPDWGRNYQFAIPAPVSEPNHTCWVWVLGRSHHDFTSADRETASALQPILSVITRQYVALSRRPRSEGKRTGGLTQRELIVLDLLSTEHSAAAAAVLLGISTRTVQKHIERIYRKLDVGNRHQAIVTARSHNIL